MRINYDRYTRYKDGFVITLFSTGMITTYKKVKKWLKGGKPFTAPPPLEADDIVLKAMREMEVTDNDQDS